MSSELIVGIIIFIYMTYQLGGEFFALKKGLKSHKYINNNRIHNIHHMLLIGFIWLFGATILGFFVIHCIVLHELNISYADNIHLSVLYYILYFYFLGITMLFMGHLKHERLNPKY